MLLGLSRTGAVRSDSTRSILSRLGVVVYGIRLLVQIGLRCRTYGGRAGRRGGLGCRLLQAEIVLRVCRHLVTVWLVRDVLLCFLDGVVRAYRRGRVHSLRLRLAA